MKNQTFKTKSLLTITLIMLFCNYLFSQTVPYWRLNGNPLLGIDGVNAGNNFIGTAGGNPTSLRFGTGGTNQIRLENATGFLGIGTIFNALNPPQGILHIHDGNSSYLQVSNGGTGFGATNGVKFGLFNNTIHALIAQQSTNPLSKIFFTTNGAPTLANVKMTINNNGNVGIGTGFINPNNKLDVDGGDIDVNTPQRSYMISDTSVLWHKGNTSNILLGALAGNNHGFNQPSENTYVGYKSGFMGNGCFYLACSPFQNVQNTLIGAYAGFNNQRSGAVSIGYAAGFTSTLSGNTFVGYRSGYLTQGNASDNAMLGAYSGENNTFGDNNSFFGTGSGRNSTTGSRNCFFGNNAGIANGFHDRNIYMGFLAGNTSSGDDNIIIGTIAGGGGVGDRNVVLGNNSMSTDTNSVENVTIGYNAAPTGDNRNFNVFIGSQSAPVIDSCNLNALIGHRTAFNQTRGVSNAYLGENTGIGVLTGTNNTFIGAKTDVTSVGSTTVINATALGANAKVTHANHMILGDNNVNVGIGLSADGIGPQKKLEIKDAIVTGPTVSNPSILGTFGASGLRFRHLTANTPTVGNPGPGVLSLDTLGNVIYVKDTLVGGGGFGGPCTSSTTTPIGLPSDWEIPLNNFNYVFSGQGLPLTTNNVGIGTNCNPQAKLHVEQRSGSNNGSIGILVRNHDSTNCSGQPVIGIKSVVTSSPLQFFKAAGWFEATNAPNCFGSPLQYAIVVPQNGGVVSLGYSPPSVSGAMLDANGSISSFGLPLTSDISLKNTVTTLPNSLNLIKRLRPVTYKWNTVNDTMMSGTHAGFIAQEVDTVIPQIVRTGSGGLKNIAYTELIPYLVSAIQAQQKTIDSLKTKTTKQDSINSAVQAQIAALTSSITSCCSSSAVRETKPSELNQLNINLSDKDVIVLNQNVPNPFAEQTTITYNLPEKYNFAQIIFSTIEGKIIKAVDITKKGRGQINVFANDLSSGMYTYSFIVDGKVIDTKKMVKSE